MLNRFLIVSLLILGLSACSSTDDKKKGENGDSLSPTVEPVAAQPGTQEDLVMSVGDRVFFNVDQSTLSAESRRQIESWAQWLKTYASVKVLIEGHCDERGTRDYNYALGDRRATAVKNYLISLGIDSYRIKTTSLGKDRPAVIGSSSQAWSQNRRGVLVVQ